MPDVCTVTGVIVTVTGTPVRNTQVEFQPRFPVTGDNNKTIIPLVKVRRTGPDGFIEIDLVPGPYLVRPIVAGAAQRTVIAFFINVPKDDEAASIEDIRIASAPLPPATTAFVATWAGRSGHVTPAIADIPGLADALAQSGGGPASWESITGKPATFPPSSHQHGLADLLASGAASGQVITWDGTEWRPMDPAGEVSGSVLWSNILELPETFPPAPHTHPDLESAIDGKADGSTTAAAFSDVADTLGTHTATLGDHATRITAIESGSVDAQEWWDQSEAKTIQANLLSRIEALEAGGAVPLSVQITGTPEEGETLTAQVSGSAPIGSTATYEWRLDGAVVASGTVTADPIQWTAQAGEVVFRLFVNGDEAASASVTVAAVSSQSFTFNAADGSTLTFNASNQLTNWSSSNGGVSITSPGNNRAIYSAARPGMVNFPKGSADPSPSLAAGSFPPLFCGASNEFSFFVDFIVDAAETAINRRMLGISTSGSTSDQEFMLQRRTNGSFGIALRGVRTDIWQDRVAIGQRHQVLVTWDGITARAYLDDDTEPTTINVGTSAAINQLLSIGSSAGGAIDAENDRVLHGAIGTIFLSDAVISLAERDALRALNVPLPAAPEAIGDLTATRPAEDEAELEWTSLGEGQKGEIETGVLETEVTEKLSLSGSEYVTVPQGEDTAVITVAGVPITVSVWAEGEEPEHDFSITDTGTHFVTDAEGDPDDFAISDTGTHFVIEEA